MSKILKRWWQDESGQIEERAVIGAILVLAVLASLQLLGGKVSQWFTSIANAY